MSNNRTWRKATTLAAAFAITLITSNVSASVVDPAVFFDHVAPFSGNPVTCSGPNGNGTYSLGYDNQLSIDGYPSGTYNFTVQGSTQSITITQTPGGIDWTSTYPIQGVIMKGSDQANFYPYVLPPNAANAPISGVTNWGSPPRNYPGPVQADTDLNFPHGSSHVEFCFGNDEQINFPPPEISKTAEGSWVRYHDWTLNKNADPDAIEMFNGDTHAVDYTIDVTKTPWGAFTVSGTIDISDPFDQGFIVDSVADTIIFGADAANTAHHPALNCGAVDDGDVFWRCTYSMTLSSKTYAYLAAGGAGVNSAAAVVHLDGQAPIDIGPATANFSFPADPVASYGDELAVDDTHDEGDHTFTDGGSFPYSLTFGCPDDEGDNPNTAIGTFSTGPDSNGTVQDDESVNVDCHVVTVQKTALTRFSRDFDWAPDKKIVVRPEDLTVEDKTVHCSLLNSGPYSGNYLCDDITIKLMVGGTYDTVYALQATKDAGTDSGRQVYGVITVSWDADAPEPVFSGDPTDMLTPSLINATVSNCVAGTNQITCDYVADVPDSSSGTNEASIVRPWVCYAGDESVVACTVPGSNTYTGTQGFSFGNPSATVDDCVALSDLFNDQAGLNLGPSFEWSVADPVCDSSTYYVTGEVTPGNFLNIQADWAPDGFEDFTPACTFYVPNVLKLAMDDNQVDTDDATIGVFVSDACNQGCTLTQGYWKTHAIYALKPQFAKKRDANWNFVLPSAENTNFFGSGVTWINVFWTPPKGNAYYNLAHQYMAAKLNGYAGASVPASVATAIANAEAWFTAHPQPTDNWWKNNKNQVNAAAGVLGSYNEGATGPGHCSEAPVAALSLILAK
jgi:hypothetical protein